MRKRVVSAAVATAVALSGWTAVTMSTAGEAGAVVPSATCMVTEGPGGLYGVSGTGFKAGETVTVRGVTSKKIRVTKAISDGFFEVTGMPNDNYRVYAASGRAACLRFVSDEEAAITCKLTKGPGQNYGISGRGFPEVETVTLKNSKGETVTTTTTTTGGYFEFSWYPNDTYTVTSKFAKVTCPKATETTDGG
ncbi:hypothetical protein [Streptomyces sp. NPDC000410]|uniref:hypothetical protein n=1 Tax=Streptomyces sp. NPDC000410 TaxID=3154254 RepID=UPI00332DA6FC